jgi:hypothetical protein
MAREHAMSRPILTTKPTSEMNSIAPFREMEFSDKECFEHMLLTATLRDESKQYWLFTNLEFPIGRIMNKQL